MNGELPPKGRSLDKLAEYLSIDRPVDRHRALADCEMTYRIVERLLERLNGDGNRRSLQRWLMQQGAHPWARFLDEVGEPPSLGEHRPDSAATAAIDFDREVLTSTALSRCSVAVDY